jgi:hypothetical protein
MADRDRNLSPPCVPDIGQRSALRAIDRQDPALDDDLRAKVRASLRDPRPSVPAADVFKRLRARRKVDESRQAWRLRERRSDRLGYSDLGIQQPFDSPISTLGQADIADHAL